MVEWTDLNSPLNISRLASSSTSLYTASAGRPNDVMGWRKLGTTGRMTFMMDHRSGSKMNFKCHVLVTKATQRDWGNWLWSCLRRNETISAPDTRHENEQNTIDYIGSIVTRINKDDTPRFPPRQWRQVCYWRNLTQEDTWVRLLSSQMQIGYGREDPP